VSPGSVSLWCQAIVLTDKQKKILRDKQIQAGQEGRQKGADMNRQKRLSAIELASEQASNDIKEISKQELFFLGLGIYWGEGVKSRTGQASVVNSDPKILRVMTRWFIECLGIERTELRPYVYISSHHKPREKIIMSYWQRELSLPAGQFKSPIYLEQRPKQQYENHDDYYGVVSLRVAKSTNLKYKILALLEVISQRLE